MEAYHVNAPTLAYFKSLNNFYPVLANEALTFFFCLTGFLISYILFSEKAFKSVNIRKFYLRRILRIWPLYYVYLLIVFGVLYAWGIEYQAKAVPFYIFFAGNFPFLFHFSIPLLGHYWTLGVEEQFYIFWPWLVKFTKRIIPLIIILIVFQVLWKLYFHYIDRHVLVKNLISINRFDCILIGALGAKLFFDQNKYFLALVDNKWVQLLAWITLIACLVFRFAWILDSEIYACIAIILMMGQIREKHPIINIEKKPLVFLGKISFSLYIFHPLLVFFAEHIFSQMPAGGIGKVFWIFVAITLPSLLLAWLSYRFIEFPFIQRKKKFMVVKSSATPVG